ncbi:MAG: hypothetical protein HGA47_07645, partial [Zoogloea sp.]|nr:hypothetical protein [Zoogloea sp.]
MFTLVGTVGHTPWRGDDLTYFAPIHGMLASGDWLVPRIAGTPLTELPPLHFWLGALLAKLFSPLLPLHDAARLASAAWTGMLLYFTGLAARRLYGRETFAPAILLTLGSLGLMIHAHES